MINDTDDDSDTNDVIVGFCSDRQAAARDEFEDIVVESQRSGIANIEVRKLQSATASSHPHKLWKKTSSAIM